MAVQPMLDCVEAAWLDDNFRQKWCPIGHGAKEQRLESRSSAILRCHRIYLAGQNMQLLS